MTDRGKLFQEQWAGGSIRDSMETFMEKGVDTRGKSNLRPESHKSTDKKLKVRY